MDNFAIMKPFNLTFFMVTAFFILILVGVSLIMRNKSDRAKRIVISSAAVLTLIGFIFYKYFLSIDAAYDEMTIVDINKIIERDVFKGVEQSAHVGRQDLCRAADLKVVVLLRRGHRAGRQEQRPQIRLARILRLDQPFVDAVADVVHALADHQDAGLTQDLLGEILRPDRDNIRAPFADPAAFPHGQVRFDAEILLEELREMPRCRRIIQRHLDLKFAEPPQAQVSPHTNKGRDLRDHTILFLRHDVRQFVLCIRGK